MRSVDLAIVLAGMAIAQAASSQVTAASPAPFAAIEPARLYASHCASCHGGDRFGGTGPALLP